ncbi:Protein of unknown function [Gryllus bimaculatus]|nr:Protein of unknown function [Gryllus bimaculatus]
MEVYGVIETRLDFFYTTFLLFAAPKEIFKGIIQHHETNLQNSLCIFVHLECMYCVCVNRMHFSKSIEFLRFKRLKCNTTKFTKLFSFFTIVFIVFLKPLELFLIGKLVSMLCIKLNRLIIRWYCVVGKEFIFNFLFIYTCPIIEVVSVLLKYREFWSS